MRISLKNQEEYRNQMYQNISHDFKTPLTVIKSYIEAYNDKIEDANTVIDVISEQTDKLELKVHSLLYLNKLDYLKDNKKVDYELVDMKKIINTAIKEFKFRRKDIKFEVTFDKNSKFYGTYDYFETVIDNSYDQENLASYIKSQISKDMDADYIFTIQLAKSQDILRYFNIPLRTWSYPNSIIIGSSINSNYTHINIDFKANFNSVTK